ncbi:hypothetical protein [Amycolatopsis sp. CA-230715]|uniref:hypothetical protein n=1 Tax=Amycolatopsis sp. CA-230715 TaxID=2745196 RepID=UPI001C0221C2|nr:hypothetical protein [Amycolatopsis sp. CA-230715]
MRWHDSTARGLSPAAGATSRQRHAAGPSGSPLQSWQRCEQLSAWRPSANGPMQQRAPATGVGAGSSCWIVSGRTPYQTLPPCGPGSPSHTSGSPSS